MTPLFKIISNYIVRLNFVISTSAGLLIAGVSHLFNIENNIEYGFFGFFSTFCVYNGQRLFKANLNTKTPWLKWVKSRRTLISSLTGISGLLAFYFFINLLNNPTPILISLIIITSFISFFYVVKLGKKNIRELPHLKIHSIAFTWTSIIVAFPIINENIYDIEFLLFFIPAHYLYIIAVTIPFDIRDLKYDLASQQTIPQVIGVKKAKIVSLMLLIITMVFISFLSNIHLNIPLFSIAILIQLFLTAYTKENKNEVYYTVLIDGAIALLGVSYLV